MPNRYVGDEGVKTRVALLAGRREQISVLLTVIAVSLWAQSMLCARFEIGHFGLIHSLPPTFFAALAILGIASALLWVSRKGHGKLLFLQLLLLISALWLIPLVTGGSQPFVDCEYRNLGMVNYMMDQGHVDSAAIWYLAWPGVFLVSTAGVLVTSLNFESIFSLSPLLMQLMYLLPLYLFLRNTLPESHSNYRWAGCWLFYLAEWCGQDYISPQGMAFFLLLTLLALATTPSLWERSPKGFTLLFMAVIVFAALSITHLLTALAALCILAALTLVKRSKRVAPIVVICLLLLVAWDITGGMRYITVFGSEPLVRAPAEPGAVPTQPGAVPAQPGIFTLDPGTIAQTEVIGHFSGSKSHNDVAKVRLLFSSVFALLGLGGIIFMGLVRRRLKNNVDMMVITLAPLVLLPISGQYGEELINRLYLFALPGMAYFGVRLLDMRSKIPVIVICAWLIVACPLHVISHYGNQELDYFPEGQVAGLRFFDRTTSHGYVIGTISLGQTNRILQYQSLSLTQLESQENRLSVKVPIQEGVPCYIGISRRDDALYRWFLGDAQFIDELQQMVNSAENCDLIYSTPYLRLYNARIDSG